MKRGLLLACCLFLAAGCGGVRRDGDVSSGSDPYMLLARRLSEAGDRMPNRKVAVLPFSYTDRRDSDDGVIVSERLLTRIMEEGRLQVVERNLIEKVMGELKLEYSGAVDENDIKTLGKILGVDAVVTGTLTRKADGTLEMHARVIAAGSAAVLSASSAIVPVDWKSAEAVPGVPGPTPAQAQAARPVSFLPRSNFRITASATTGRFISDFHPTVPMTTGRSSFGGVLLQNGKVLIAGGAGAGGALSSAELYDPATSSFTITGSMSTARYIQRMTLLPNGKVLVTGGASAANQSYASAELYDPVAGTFSSAGSMSTSRLHHTATLLPNGKVLIAGGAVSGGFVVTASADLYDPATGTFTPTGSMSVPRNEHTATLLRNGEVVTVGGESGWGGGTRYSSAELYDPATGTFAPTGSMNTIHVAHIAALMADGRVLVAGGIAATATISTAEIYDPDTWQFSPTGSMNASRHYFDAVLLGDNKVLVAGGTSGPSPLASAELYDPASGTFSPIGPMNYPRAYCSLIKLANGQVLATGGNDGGAALSQADLYGQPADFPSAWKYRENFRIAERSGTSLVDYQALVKFDSAAPIRLGRMKPDCSDLRFANSDEKTGLNYWLESGCGTGETRVWVRFPFLAKNSVKNFYMYYGNSGAVSESSGDRTFRFFDDFNDGDIDPAKWTVVDGDCRLSETGGDLEFTGCSGGSAARKTGLMAVPTLTPPYLAEFDGMTPDSGDNGMRRDVLLRWDGKMFPPYNGPVNAVEFNFYDGISPSAPDEDMSGCTGAKQFTEKTAPPDKYDSCRVLTPGIWRHYRISDEGAVARAFWDTRELLSLAIAPTRGSHIGMSAREYPAGAKVYYDNFRVRGWASVDPEVSVYKSATGLFRVKAHAFVR